MKDGLYNVVPFEEVWYPTKLWSASYLKVGFPVLASSPVERGDQQKRDTLEHFRT